MSKRLLFFLFILTAGAVAAGCAGLSAGQRTSARAEEINERKAQAYACMQAGDYATAIEVLLPISEENRQDGQIETLLGEAYWRSGDYESATAHFEEALRLDRGDWQAHMKLAQVLTEQGKVGRALTEFELAIQFSDREAITHYNYGLSLYEFGRPEAAIAQWEIALSLDRTPRYAAALGMALSGVDDEKAREYFVLADELGAEDADFHNNFGLLLTRRGEYDLAEEQLRAAASLEPDNRTFQTNIGLLYLQAGRYGDAVPVWRGLLDADSSDRVSRIYLGKALHEVGRHRDAIELLESWLGQQDTSGAAATSRPGFDEAFGILAMSYRAEGEGAPALRYIRRAVDLAPRSSIHLNNYGVILAENGKIDEAKAQWAKVLELEPDNAVAKQNLAAFDR